VRLRPLPDDAGAAMPYDPAMIVTTLAAFGALLFVLVLMVAW
jgi:hypothetical protein